MLFVQELQRGAITIEFLEDTLMTVFRNAMEIAKARGRDQIGEDTTEEGGPVISLMPILGLLTWAHGTSVAELPSNNFDLDFKRFEAAVALADKLTNWAIAIIGGSILVLIGTSYRRPTSRKSRAMFLLFLPGWVSLCAAVYYGIRVQEVHLAYLFGRDFVGRTYTLRLQAISDARWLIRLFTSGLGFFSLWLFAYLIWWVRTDWVGTEKG